jgi:hypothetical protein
LGGLGLCCSVGGEKGFRVNCQQTQSERRIQMRAPHSTIPTTRRVQQCTTRVETQTGAGVLGSRKRGGDKEGKQWGGKARNKEGCTRRRTHHGERQRQCEGVQGEGHSTAGERQRQCVERGAQGDGHTTAGAKQKGAQGEGHTEKDTESVPNGVCTRRRYNTGEKDRDSAKRRTQHTEGQGQVHDTVRKDKNAPRRRKGKRRGRVRKEKDSTRRRKRTEVAQGRKGRGTHHGAEKGQRKPKEAPRKGGKGREG